MEDIALNLSLDEIIKELDDKNLLYMTSGKIKELKNNILQKLYLNRDELLNYHKKLNEYIYIDELDEVKLGSYIRWFNLKNMENLKLTNGGIVVDFKQGVEDVVIVCKNKQGRFFSLQLNKTIIFKKMSSQEKLLIKIIDYIHK